MVSVPCHSLKYFVAFPCLAFFVPSTQSVKNRLPGIPNGRAALIPLSMDNTGGKTSAVPASDSLKKLPPINSTSRSRRENPDFEFRRKETS